MDENSKKCLTRMVPYGFPLCLRSCRTLAQTNILPAWSRQSGCPEVCFILSAVPILCCRWHVNVSAEKVVLAGAWKRLIRAQIKTGVNQYRREQVVHIQVERRISAPNWTYDKCPNTIRNVKGRLLLTPKTRLSCYTWLFNRTQSS